MAGADVLDMPLVALAACCLAAVTAITQQKRGWLAACRHDRYRLTGDETTFGMSITPVS